MRLGEYTSHTIFEAITSALEYTYKPPPTYKYGFWEARRLIDEWNENMEKKLHAILGVVSGRFNDQVSERVHMPWPPVHPKKSMVVRKRIPYNCLWFDTGVVPDGDLKRQVLYVSTAIKIIVGLGGNCRSNLAIDKTIVARCQACYPWEWVLRLERNSWVAEEGSVCLGTHQEAPLLAKIY